MTATSPTLTHAPTEHGELFEPGHRFGRFDIKEVLGTTGMAAVYRAREMGARREVALKVLAPRFTQVRGLLEYLRRVAKRDYQPLTHAHLVPLYRVGVSAGRVFIARGYLPGGSAQDQLDGGRVFSADEALEIVATLTPALNYLHRQGLTHQNLKPANILFDPDGDAHLADVGMAPLLEAAAQTFLEPGVRLSTPAFLAPEQLSGKPVTPRTDIYSLGAVLFALLTGEPPFATENARELLELQLTQPTPSARERNPDVPAELDAALQRALSFAPDRRFEWLGPFLAELGIPDVLPEAARPVPKRPQPAEPSPKPAAEPAPAAPPESGAPTLPQLEIGQRFARLTLRELIAQTDLNLVYRASDSTDKRQVALKILADEFGQLPKFDAYFRSVVKRFSQLKHPHLVTLLNGGQSQGVLYYAMPFMAGGTLQDRMAGGPLDSDAALAILKDIAPALSYLHQEGVVHQNIKPRNILFNAEGKAYLSEVGLAPMLYTAANTFADPSQLGPFDYKSPEQLAGRRKGSQLDPRSDIYSLGVLLFEMLTGETPFHAESASDLGMLQFSSTVPSARQLRPRDLPALDRALDEVLQVALSFSPKARFESVSELMTAITGALPLELPASDVLAAEAPPAPAAPPVIELPAVPAITPVVEAPPAPAADELLQLDLPAVGEPVAEAAEGLMQLDTLQLLGEAAAPAAPTIPVAPPKPIPERPRVVRKPRRRFSLRQHGVLAVMSVLGLVGILGIGVVLAFSTDLLQVEGINRVPATLSAISGEAPDVPLVAAGGVTDTPTPASDAAESAGGAAAGTDGGDSQGGDSTADGTDETAPGGGQDVASDLSASGGASETPEPESASATLTATVTDTETTSTATVTNTFTPTPSNTVTVGPSPTGVLPTATPSQTNTATQLPTSTSTTAPTFTPTTEPTDTATAAATVTPSFTPTTDGGQDPAISQAELDIITLTNQERAAGGVSPQLLQDGGMMSIAQQRSDDMAARDYFSHNDPVTGEVIIFNLMVGYGSVGENLFTSSGGVSVGDLANQALAAWMSSSGHRANILNSTYQYIGVGIAFDDSCPNFGGQCWIVTQLFASQTP